MSLILLFFITSCSFCIWISYSFFYLSILSWSASRICFSNFIWFYWAIAAFVCSLNSMFIYNLSSSSYSLCILICSFLNLSSSFLALIWVTYSAFLFVSSIFFHAFFSSSFKRAILLARSFASSAAFFLFILVATNAPVISSSGSYS